MSEPAPAETAAASEPRAAPAKPKRTIRRKRSNPSDPPKMPRIMRHVRKQIERHPRFNDLPDGTRLAHIFAYALGSKNMSPNGRAFARALWMHLYAGTPLPCNA